MNFGSLFSGNGGLDLGLERAGMKCLWQVEIDPFCRSVLAKHWPHVPKFSDAAKFCREQGNCDGCIETGQVIRGCGRVDLICGGFPCQDVSNAGLREGIEGEQSGLWREFARVLRELRPRYAVVENVGALAVRGLPRVLGDLAEIGFDAEWSMLPAAAFGAVHRRERLFIVAYPSGDGLEGGYTTAAIGQSAVASLDHLHDWPALSAPFGLRSTDGVSNFVDRINALGNAVVPNVAEWIGRRIMERESCHASR